MDNKKLDKLQDAEESKNEEVRKHEEKHDEDTLAEDSMVETTTHNDPEMLVSTEEDAGGGEPEFREKEGKKTEDKAADDEGTLDEDAMVDENKREETKTLVSDSDVMSDEEMEREDDTEEVHSDEDEHDEHASHELEMPDYGEYSPEQLVAEAEKLLKNQPVQKIKNHFDSIRRNLMKQLNEERQHKLEEFLKDGGVEIDFEYIQPLRERFRKIFSEYRQKRQQYYNELKDKLNANLKIKLNLIEQLKEIVNKEESIGETFKEFNKIQEEWRNTGPVPRAESGDLWRTYHHHVENFYEYIKINKELRDLDFKKNREAKEELIKEAEALTEHGNVPEAFKKLQNLHKKWKNLGPVEREQREPMWERFSAATAKLHERRDKHYDELREKAGERIEEKKKLIAKLEELSLEELKTHHQWQDAIKKVEEIRTDFKKVGRVNHPENDEVWDRFRRLLREFNHSKNEFYKNLKKGHQENLAKKRELIEIAESLKDSEDWRETTNEMKRIQAEWKRIGHVPRSESDRVWKRFRAACNHFFDRLTEHNKERDQEFEGNYQKKEELLEKLKAFDTKKQSQQESVKALKEIIGEWKEIGRVPRSKTKIESDFNKTLDEKFKEIDLDRKESQRIRFENKMESMSDQGGTKELQRERENVRRALEDARKELNQLETNISFFSSSNSKNPLIKEVEKNIAKQRQQIELLQEKDKMLTVKMREMKKAESSEGEEK